MKIILFDIDDTLMVVPKQLNVAASKSMFKKVFGIAAHEEMIQNSGKTEKKIIREVLQKVAPHLWETINTVPKEAYETWAKETASILLGASIKILPGVVELLTFLSAQQSVVLGLLTGNSMARAQAKLQSIGMDSFFQDSSGMLRGAFGNTAEKRSDLIHLAQKSLGKENDLYMLVDDSLIGAKMAQKYAIPSIFVATGRASKGELAQFVPVVFKDFGEGRWEKAGEIIISL